MEEWKINKSLGTNYRASRWAENKETSKKIKKIMTVRNCAFIAEHRSHDDIKC